MYNFCFLATSLLLNWLTEWMNVIKQWLKLMCEAWIRYVGFNLASIGLRGSGRLRRRICPVFHYAWRPCCVCQSVYRTGTGCRQLSSVCRRSASDVVYLWWTALAHHISSLPFGIRVYLPSSSSCLPFGVRTDEFLNCSSPTLIRRTRHSTDVGP